MRTSDPARRWKPPALLVTTPNTLGKTAPEIHRVCIRESKGRNTDHDWYQDERVDRQRDSGAALGRADAQRARVEWAASPVTTSGSSWK